MKDLELNRFLIIDYSWIRKSFSINCKKISNGKKERKALKERWRKKEEEWSRWKGARDMELQAQHRSVDQ